MAAVSEPETVLPTPPAMLDYAAIVAASPELQMLCKAQGMELQPNNELQIPDWDFVLELAKLPIDFTAIPGGTDVQAMRRWIDNDFLKGPLAEYRARCDIQRRRPRAKVEIRDVSIPCSDGSQDTFGIRVYEPQAEDTISKQRSRPAILMVHGGGWIHGNPIGDETMSMIFASELNAVVFGIDYRLAPEHQFPAPLDDCTAALDWVVQSADEYRLDTSRIGLWGASAGGNLAAAVALRHSREQRQPALRFVSLVVPVTAHPRAQAAFIEQRTLARSELEEKVADAKPAPEAVVRDFEKLYELYIGPSTNINDPLASPLMATGISNHPRTHVTVAACDYLMPQGLSYAQVLRSFDTEVTEEILPGVPHGFTFPMNAGVTRRWLERQRDLFMEAFGDTTAGADA